MFYINQTINSLKLGLDNNDTTIIKRELRYLSLSLDQISAFSFSQESLSSLKNSFSTIYDRLDEDEKDDLIALFQNALSYHKKNTPLSFCLGELLPQAVPPPEKLSSSYDQSLFLPHMRILGYTTVSAGMCAGFSLLAIQNALAENLPSFFTPLTLFINLCQSTHPSNIKKIINKLPSEQKNSLMSLLDGIELYAQAHRYSYLFEEEQRPSSQLSSLLMPSLSVLLASPSLESKGGGHEVIKFSGLYQEEDFKSLLLILDNSLQDNKKPIGILFCNQNHAISVVYDNKEKNWFIFDAEKIYFSPFLRLEDLANTLYGQLRGPLPSPYTAICIRAYTTRSDRDSFLRLLEDWKERCISPLTKENAQIVDSKGTTWLCVAIQSEEEALCQSLLAKEAIPNHKTLEGMTPLMYAAGLGNEHLIDYLITADLDSFAVTKENLSPLFFAIESGHLSIVKRLLAKIYAVYELEFSQNSEMAIHCRIERILCSKAPINTVILAARLGHVSCLYEILTALEKTKDLAKERHLETPIFDQHALERDALLHAILSTQENVVHFLLERKVHIDKNHLLAAATSSLAIFKDLINHGAHISAGEKKDLLTLALDAEYESIALLLLEAGTTALPSHLLLSAEKGLLTFVQRLIQQGFSIDTQDDTGKTALFLASSSGQKEVVSYLLQNGAQVDIPLICSDPDRPENGLTPLMIAAFNGHKEVVQILLNAGADKSKRIQSGADASFLALENGEEDLYHLLKTV